MDEAAEPAPDLSPLHVRPVQAGDDEAVVRCLAAAFGSSPHAAGDGTASALAAWRWKFLANPAGRGWQMLAVHPDEGVVGVYAAQPVLVTCRGRRMLAAHAVEQCVLPRWLRHGGAHGLFPALGRAFLDRWLGDGEGRAAFVYGLPVTSWRSGARHLGWQVAREWLLVFRELRDGEPVRATPAALEVRAVARFGADVDALFARLEPTFGLATVRDRRHLDWRYADRPDHRYTLFECRERATGALRGVCVFGVTAIAHADRGCIVDWLAAADDIDTTVAMLAALEARTREAGCALLGSVWNPSDPRFATLQSLGYRVGPLPWFLAVASERLDVTWFRDAWYFTIGDSDLV